MAPQSAATPTTGARKADPVVSLPRELHPDPIRSLAALLDAGLSPELVFPIESAGLQSLLHATKLARDVDDEVEAAQLALLAECRHLPSRFDGRTAKPTQAESLAQEALRRQLAGHPNAPRSAIRVHPTPAGLNRAAQDLICQPGWFLDPSLAVVVAVDLDDLCSQLALLRDPVFGQGSNEDPLAAAQWVAEELMPPLPGWKFDGPPPVRLASEIKPDESWREMFLSPNCLEMPALGLLQAIGAARIGLHLIKLV